MTEPRDVWQVAAEKSGEPAEPDTVAGVLGAAAEEWAREALVLFVVLTAVGVGFGAVYTGGWAYGLIAVAVPGTVLAFVALSGRWRRIVRWVVLAVLLAVNIALIAVLAA